MSVQVRLVPADRLREAAILSHMGLRQRGRIDASHIEEDADPPTVQRWMVNYARHRLTDYDRMVRGTRDGRAVKLAALDAIAAVYPFLAAECARQAAEARDA